MWKFIANYLLFLSFNKNYFKLTPFNKIENLNKHVAKKKKADRRVTILLLTVLSGLSWQISAYCMKSLLRFACSI